MNRVLIIDDDAEMCALLQELLEPEFQITSRQRGDEGAALAAQGDFALIVLDVMLPGLGGFEVLRRLRSDGCATPVLMLTARGDDVDRIVGLELGADDYLPKPFNPRELSARIHAILRRARPATSPREKLRCDDVELDSLARTVRRGGEAVELTAVEFDLLALLMKNPGAVVSRDEIARRVLDRKWTAYDRSIDMHVSNLRKKLGATPNGERIKSIRSVGYVLVSGTE
jgi:DNA-binding response OmpR family regulator